MGTRQVEGPLVRRARDQGAAPLGAGGSPASVHRGEGEGHALEEQEHEEPLTRRAVSHALAVLARLGWVE